MKLNKQIAVASKPYPLVSDTVALNLFTPGRAVFTVLSSEALAGTVVFSLGYSSSIKPWFIGFIESSTKVDEKQQRIFCRELTAALFFQLPLALRDVSLAQALQAISAATGLNFVLPSAATTYTSIKAPAFYNLANGYYALDMLAQVFNIKKLVWQQQPDGKVWVGSWDDSPLASTPVTIPNKWEKQTTIANGATVPLLPALRPGVMYNDNILTSVEISGTKMALTWAKNPWAER